MYFDSTKFFIVKFFSSKIQNLCCCFLLVPKIPVNFPNKTKKNIYNFNFLAVRMLLLLWDLCLWRLNVASQKKKQTFKSNQISKITEEKNQKLNQSKIPLFPFFHIRWDKKMMMKIGGGARTFYYFNPKNSIACCAFFFFFYSNQTEDKRTQTDKL